MRLRAFRVFLGWIVGASVVAAVVFTVVLTVAGSGPGVPTLPNFP